MELKKILDQRINLTEEQFVKYLNSAFYGYPEDEIMVYDIDENGHRGPYSFQLIEDIQSHFDKRFILIFGSIDSIGERIGHLEVYNTGSLPPRFVLMVQSEYSEKITDYVSKMLTVLNITTPAAAETSEQVPKETPALEKKYQKLIYDYLHQYSGRVDVESFLQDYATYHNLSVSLFKFQRIFLKHAEKMGLIAKSNPKKKKSRWVWIGDNPD